MYVFTLNQIKTFVFALLASTQLVGAPGSLDTSFGSSGTVIQQLGSTTGAVGRAIVIQPDGKIVLVGYANDGANKIAVMRFTSSGALDTAGFNAGGTPGYILTSVGGVSNFGFAVALQPDAKIVVTGYASISGAINLVVARYNTDGTLDTTFGSPNGYITQLFGVYTHAYGLGVVVQPDGKILVTGYVETPTTDIVVARFTSTGALDTTFNTIGYKIQSLFTTDRGNAIILQPDGKIIIAAYAGAYFTVLRFTSTGALDTTFNGTGYNYSLPAGAGTYTATSVALQSDGKIVLAGYIGTTPFIIARYTTNGILDTAEFAPPNGYVTLAAGTAAFDYSVNLQSDGKIIAGGFVTQTNNKFAAARYTTEGTLDTTFGSPNGYVLTLISGTTASVAYSSDIQADGKIVVGGYATASGVQQFALARYHADPAYIGALVNIFKVSEPA